MTKLIAVALLWISVVRSRARYYLHHYRLLTASETTDIPGVTIRIRWGKWLHYYTIGGHQ
jgi:5-carboxymethyl-2-hydroxymuconate isomerase